MRLCRRLCGQVTLSKERLDQLLESEITHFALKRQDPVTLRKILSVKSVWVVADFISHELPVRFASRIKQLEALPTHPDVMFISRVRSIYAESFKQLRMVQPTQREDFTKVLTNLKKRHSSVVPLLITGIRLLKEKFPEQLTEEFLNDFLNKFFLSRIGTEMLTSQFLAGAHGKGDGIIDRVCDPDAVIRRAAKDAERLCYAHYGCCPPVQVWNRGVDRWPYIPQYLYYILFELFKNSMRAVVEKAQQSDNHHAVLPIDNELHLVSFAPDVPQPPSAPFSGNPTSPYGPLHQHPPDHPSLVYPVTISLDDESPEGTQRTFPSSPQPSRPYTCRNETSQPADGYGSSDGRSSGGPGTMAPATVTATSLPAFGGGGSGGGQRVCQGSHSIRVDTGAEVELPPVQVILSGDNHQVAIKIADEGGGIAREAESKIWSYLYTTAKPIGEPSNEQDSQVKNMPHAPHTGPFGYLDRSQRNGLRPGSSPDASKPSISPLAGFGCGLPLSRLYAQYLGGSLKVVSMPRWGTDAYLFLSKIGDIQERVPPGWSVPLAWQSAERQRAGGSGLLDVGDIPTQEDQASQHYPPFAL